MKIKLIASILSVAFLSTSALASDIRKVNMSVTDLNSKVLFFEAVESCESFVQVLGQGDSAKQARVIDTGGDECIVAMKQESGVLRCHVSKVYASIMAKESLKTLSRYKKEVEVDGVVSIFNEDMSSFRAIQTNPDICYTTDASIWSNS